MGFRMGCFVSVFLPPWLVANFLCTVELRDRIMRSIQEKSRPSAYCPGRRPDAKFHAEAFLQVTKALNDILCERLPVI